MMFLWHHALWLLLALPALVGTYLLLLRRKNKEALRYAAFGVVREAIGSAALFRRHVPALLLLLGITALLISAARPVFVTTSPSKQGTVVLLMDVSLSMAAIDVPPTRLAAARAAAMAFVEAQPQDVRIAIVAFGGHADLVQPPTANRRDVMAALDQLELQRFTAIGNGLIAAVLTLVPSADVGQEYDIFGSGRAPVRPSTIPLDKTQKAATRSQKPVRPGSYLSAAIILVSDGLGTMGVPPLKAAKIAADHGIRVYTVGVGTLYGGVAHVDGWAPIQAEFDDATLREIADITRGEYFLARNADKVTKIYEKLGRRVILERTEREITALFTAIGLLLSIVSALLSVSWSTRPA
jgi:Ca-activated chloride channel family protein